MQGCCPMALVTLPTLILKSTVAAVRPEKETAMMVPPEVGRAEEGEALVSCKFEE